MNSKLPPLALEDGLDLKQILTTGSLLHINEDYEDNNSENDRLHSDPKSKNRNDIGEPVKSLDVLRKQLKQVDDNDFVKKKVIEDGGGDKLNDSCTVSFAFTGYWEGDDEPFDVRKIDKPLVVDIKENSLLPGLQIAIKSMLVGELSVFLLSYKVMYGEMGIPPRIKPKADCVFYIKLINSTIKPHDRDLDSTDSNTFREKHHEVKMLYCSGVALFKVINYSGAVQLFRKAIFILHSCRLADETEQCVQEKLLIKLYLNLAICYNKIKQPLKACVACNELNRLGSLWNNGKALFQNSKALRMIGKFEDSERKLKQAMKLCPNNKEMIAEYELLQATQECCDLSKLCCSGTLELISDNFKQEVDNLVKSFKQNTDLYKMTLPSKLNSVEIDYIKEVCTRENLFLKNVQRNYSLDKDEDAESVDKNLIKTSMSDK